MQNANCTQYEKRYVLFIDILGFGQYIDQSVDADGTMDSTRIINAGDFIQTLRKHTGLDDDVGSSMSLSPLLKEAQTTQFSDSIVISFPVSKENLEKCLFSASHIFWLGVHHEFIVRGAIVSGYIIHNERLLYGPGFNDAYKMEKDKAIYPRIVVDDEIEKEVAATLPERYCLIVNDQEKISYLNMFVGLQWRFQSPSERCRLFHRLESIIEKEEKNKCIHVKEKYEWLKKNMQDNRAYLLLHKDEGAMRLS